MRAGAIALWLAVPAAGQARDDSERTAWVARGETELERGDAASALDAFERATALGHGADGEMGLVRASMQSGRYRQALAFCAHVAGEHFDTPGAAVLYAWLLRVGGQREVSNRSLAEAILRGGAGDALTSAAARELARPEPVAHGVLLEPPHRVAPYDVVASGLRPIPPRAHVVASGVLVDGGHRALVPRSALSGPDATRFWVRDGLGRSSAIEIDVAAVPAATPGVVLVRLQAPLRNDDLGERDGSDPHAGSPAFAVGYATSSAATPAWPLLNLGFLGGPIGASGLRRLGIEVGEGALGGPVFGATGGLVGIVVRGSEGAAWWPRSAWPAEVRAGAVAIADPAPPRTGLPMPIDAVYERALRIALQVIAAP